MKMYQYSIVHVLLLYVVEHSRKQEKKEGMQLHPVLSTQAKGGFLKRGAAIVTDGRWSHSGLTSNTVLLIYKINTQPMNQNICDFLK